MDAAAPAPEALNLVAPEDVVLGLDASDMKAALNRLLERALAAAPESLAEILARDEWQDAFHPLELAPGAILLHAHVAGGSALPESRVLVGISRGGSAFSGRDCGAECLFLLRSPADQSAEMHLQKLAAIARCLRGPGRLERLLAAQTPAEAAAAIG
jgi:mannitol/fructose-specific phosphotransferase system IIA component (Ntr-type)